MGRTDIPQYQHACKTLRNMILTPSGMAYRRPGTLFVDAIAGATNYPPRFFPFYSRETSGYPDYCLAIYKPVSGNCTVVGFRAVGVTATNNTTSSVSGPSSGSVNLPYLPSSLSTSRTDEWREIQYIQSGDILYLVHPNRKPQRIYRTASDTFVVAPFDSDYKGDLLSTQALASDTTAGENFKNAWPYLPQNSVGTSPATSGITLTISDDTVGTGRTVTASAALFATTHVGAVFKGDVSGTVGCFLITARASSTSVTASVIVAFGATGASTLIGADWWESAWSDYRGWPRSITLGVNRIFYGGTSFQPDYFWATQNGDYNQLSMPATTNPYATSLATDSFTVALPSPIYSKIQWMDFDKNLVVGTDKAEWVVSETVAGDGFIPSNLSAARQGNFGSAHRQPIRIESTLVHVDSSGGSIGVIIFDDNRKSFIRQSLNDFYPEFPAQPISQYAKDVREMTWDQTRRVIWCTDSWGNIRGVTYDPQSKILAWHSHTMGGYDASSYHAPTSSTSFDTLTNLGSDGCVTSVLSLQGVLGTEVWVCVKRYINSALTYHIERMVGGLPPDTTTGFTNFATLTLLGNYYTDASVPFVYSVGSPSGGDFGNSSELDHLEGESVAGTVTNERGVFAATCSDVTSGITVVSQYTSLGIDAVSGYISIGLPFSSTVQPVRPDLGSQIGSAQGALKRIHEVNVRFYRTLAAKVGSDADTLETIIFRDGSTLMGYSPELFTGDKRVKLQSTYDYDGYIYILQDKPLPFAVVGISMEGQVYD